MNGTFQAKVINIDGSCVTYEYADKSGVVQISSLRPTGIKIKVGDKVWITLENGTVVSVGKRRPAFSTPSGIKFISAMIIIVILLVLWVVFFFLKKLLIAFAWVILIAIAAVFIFTRLKR